MTRALSQIDPSLYRTLPTKPQMHRHIPALDLNLIDASPEAAIAALLAPGRRRAFFMNAHCCNIRRKDRDYAAAVTRADMLLPDGIGVELAARMTDDRLTANLNGTDLLPELLREAAQRGKSVYLFGGKPGTAEAAADRLTQLIPSLIIAGTRDGYGGAQNPETVIADINASGAAIVLVAMGVPLQEIWLDRHAHRLDAPLALAVGALFDFLAGTVVRAPKAVRAARMEWAWRLAQEPRRLAKRYLAGNFTFLAHAGVTALRRVPARDLGKRAFDIAMSSTALLLLSPVLALTAIAVKCDSQGPALFKQTRVGRNGVPFTMYKFRSMKTQADAMRHEIAGTSDREGICFKSRKDPRITRVGRFIRRYSIDELPQIVNVLRGEMSMVGPRPALPSEVAQFPARALGRLAVKPGITGVWQVSGRADVSFDVMIEMDLTYAASRSVLVDIGLILRTFGAVLSARGAF